jgi:hypothetical protein
MEIVRALPGKNRSSLQHISPAVLVIVTVMFVGPLTLCTMTTTGPLTAVQQD